MESTTRSLQSKEGQPSVVIDDSHKKCKCKVCKIRKIDTEGDTATVEIAVGGLSGSPEGIKIRSSILNSEYFKEYGPDTEVEDITIEEEKYEEFDQYRFVFKKNGDNIYSFEKVEQP